jgi:hypothetical protein
MYVIGLQPGTPKAKYLSYIYNKNILIRYHIIFLIMIIMIITTCSAKYLSDI